MIKLVAVDVDGTLLNKKHELSQKNIESIIEVQKRGIKVVPFTGRSFDTLENHCKSMELKDAVCTQNGNMAINPQTGGVIFETLIPVNIIIEVLKHAEISNTSIAIYQEEKVFVSTYNKYTKIFEDCMNKKVEYDFDILKNYNAKPLGKILILDENRKVKAFQNWLKENFNNEVYAALSYDFSLEIGANSKGKSLLKLADYFEIDKEEILAIGDGENDIEMLQCAGISIAMGNAMEQVKKHATYITKNNDNDGVAWALNKFVLSK